MALKLFCDAYEHSPQPDVEINRQALMDEDNKKRIGTREVWRVGGTITGTSIADINTKLLALEAAYASPAALYLKEGATTRESLLGANARNGLFVEGPSYPEGNRAEYATKRRFEFTISGSFYDGGEKGDPEILWLEETTSYEYDQHEKATRTIRGRLQTQEGVSAAGKWATVTPSIPSGYNRVASSKETNNDDDELVYAFTDLEYWLDWATNVTGGDYTTEQSRGTNGILRVMRQGRFVGSGAYAAAQNLRLDMPQFKPLSESETANLFDGSFSFRYEYIDLTNSDTDLISFVETVSVEYGGQDFVVLEALDGADPERQETVITPARARQSGSAVGASDWPTFPDPLWSTTYRKPPYIQEKSGPDLTVDGEYTNYRITWSYNFLFDTASITHHDPNVATITVPGDIGWGDAIDWIFPGVE